MTSSPAHSYQTLADVSSPGRHLSLVLVVSVSATMPDSLYPWIYQLRFQVYSKESEDRAFNPENPVQ